MLRIVINLVPVTKKNHQEIMRNKKTGKLFVTPSRQFKQYQRECGKYMPKENPYIKSPVNIKAVYYMPTRHRVDLTNLNNALCDVLVHYGVIADDNMRIVVTMDGSKVCYDKAHPRTEIEITDTQASFID